MDTLIGTSGRISIQKNMKTGKKALRLKSLAFMAILFLTLGLQNTFGQGVGISETSINPHESAILELRSTARGFLVPRMTTTQRTGISAPADGLMVFDTNTKSFWYYDTDVPAWEEITNKNLLDLIYDALNNRIIADSLRLSEDSVRLDDAIFWFDGRIEADSLRLENTIVFFDDRIVADSLRLSEDSVRLDETITWFDDRIIADSLRLSEDSVRLDDAIVWFDDRIEADSLRLSADSVRLDDAVTWFDDRIIADSLRLSADSVRLDDAFTWFDDRIVADSIRLNIDSVRLDDAIVWFDGRIEADSLRLENTIVSFDDRIVADSLRLSEDSVRLDETITWFDDRIIADSLRIENDVVLRDGSQSLTSAWDAGSFGITAETFTSDVADGTAPLTVTSTTLVANLNADMLDGKNGPTGDIVGTTDTQTLTNKTLTSPTLTTPDIGEATGTSLQLSGLIASRPVRTDGSNNLVSGQINLASSNEVTGTLPVANGGTGATTATAAFDALSPMITEGDIIYGGASGTGTRLPKGTAGQVLTMNAGATAPEWTNATDDQTASEVNSTAYGNIEATDVQAAIQELDDEKLALTGGTMSGAINMNSNNISNGGTISGSTITDGTISINSGNLSTTGSFSLDGVDASNYIIGASTTTGTIDIGGTAQTGTITLGASTSAQTVNVGTGTAATTVKLATGNSNSTVQIGDSGTPFKSVIFATVTTNSLSVNKDNNTIDTYTVTGAEPGAALIVNPSNPISGAGIFMNYARVSGTNTIEIGWNTANNGGETLNAGQTLNIMVINK